MRNEIDLCLMRWDLCGWDSGRAHTMLALSWKVAPRIRQPRDATVGTSCVRWLHPAPSGSCGSAGCYIPTLRPRPGSSNAQNEGHSRGKDLPGAQPCSLHPPSTAEQGVSSNRRCPSNRWAGFEPPDAVVSPPCGGCLERRAKRAGRRQYIEIVFKSSASQHSSSSLLHVTMLIMDRDGGRRRIQGNHHR